MKNKKPDQEGWMASEKEKKKAAVTRFPTPILKKEKPLSKEEKISIIKEKFREILEVLDLDLDDDSLKRTPERIAKMYVEEIFSGLNEDTFPEVSFFEDRFQHNKHSNTVMVKVNFTSFCEHHFVPMNGTAYVSYIPNNKLIGLSKIPRIVRYFARRPQVQERLTAQIADSLCLLLDTEDVAVTLAARHYCVIARGIEDENGHTVTNVLRGQFETNDAVRREFFEGVNRKHPTE